MQYRCGRGEGTQDMYCQVQAQNLPRRDLNEKDEDKEL